MKLLALTFRSSSLSRPATPGKGVLRLTSAGIEGHPVTAMSRGHPSLTAIRSGKACGPPAIVRLHAYCGAVPVPRVFASEEVRHARSRGHRWAGRDAAGR